MEIKRRLTKVAKSLSPQIEAMNVGQEMMRMCDRFEELVRYAQEKIDRSAERIKKNQPTIGKKVDDARKAADKEITDHQTAEVEENQRDQKEAFDERNKDPGLIDGEASTVSDAMTEDQPAPEPGPLPDMTKKSTHPKKTAKKKGSKK